MPLLDEPSILEFERLCNQANSLEKERTDLGLSLRATRTRSTQVSAASGVLAVVAMVGAILLGAPTWLLIAAAVLTLVSVIQGVRGSYGSSVEQETQHLASAREFAAFRDICQVIVAEHEAGQLKRSDFRRRLEHHTERFRVLVQDLEHPYR